jgi:hypothetical protein
MKSCEYCGSELPVNAQFCGNCGHMLADSYATVTDVDNALGTAIPARQTPPLFSNPLNPSIQVSGMEWQGLDSTLQTRWSVENIERVNPQFTDHETDENEAVLPDLLLPGMLAIQGKMPSPAQTPMVQGTPQVGGVPSVQGTPAVPGNVAQSIPGPVHGAASSAPSYAPQEAQFIPAHLQPVQQPEYQPSPYHYQPVHHPQPAPPPHELEHQHRHHTGPLHQHRPHSSRLHHPAALTSKAGMSVVSKWLIIIVVSLLVIGSSSILLAHALMPPTPLPVLTISGTNVVRNGGVLHLHGQGFQPGDGVTLKIDNGLPVSLTGQHGTQTASQGTKGNAQVIDLAQMNIADLLQPHSAAGINISVSSKGTFDANVTVPSGLVAGKHSIHATDNQSSQSASLQFTVPSSQLAVNPTTLNFGSVEVGRTVNLSVTVSNQGGASLHWAANVEGSNTNWLTLPNSSGVLGTNGLGDSIIVTANTNNLSVGSHSATLRFHSDNGDVQTTVKINVISIGQSGQQAILKVSQQNLDFGQLQAGQQAKQSFSIANLGNLPLQWQASSDAAGATWLSLTTTKGTVQTGAAPQAVQVNVNTTGLSAGSYTGTITVTSNGGQSQVGITLVVTASTQTTMVTGISPASGPVTGGTNVTITGTGLTGATSVSFGQTPAINVNVKSDTQIIVTSPAGSGLVDVTVTTPGGTSATSSSDQFTYTPVPPTWSVNPTSLDSSTCGQTGPCQVTLTEDANSTTDITWSASSNVGAIFKPQKGTLSPNGPNSVSVSILAPCKNDTFTFTGSGGVNPLKVSWTCSSSPATGGTWAGIFTYYNPKNGSQFNATLTLPTLPPEGQSGSPFNNGTLSEPAYNTVVYVNGTVGTNLSEFNSGGQAELQAAIQVWGSSSGKYLVFSDPGYVTGNQVVLNCSYAAIEGPNGQWEGVWFYPDDSSPDGTFNLNQA